MDKSQISRRDFLLSSTAAAGALAATELLGQNANREPRPVLHIIGYSHIDAAWLWPWRDGSNLALTTARSALDRMTETPGFRYCHSSSIHYRWIQRADPQMFEEIRQRVREGRWEVVGAWPVEPDCNLPATESFARHALYGKMYCQSNLGVDVKIGFNPDSFGHSAGLPTILKHSGYNYYVFMRPQENEMNLPLLFWWEGPDGSRVLTLRILHSYENPATKIPGVAKSSFAPGFSHGAFFLGVGDHGGAVTKAQIQEVLQLRNDASLPELRWSTMGEFFHAVESSPAMRDLPVVHGELQHHSRGCYSACGEEKYHNRRSERALVQTESIALLSALSLGRKYPGADFEKAWWNVLFNQFHDLMAGTSLYTDYQDARDGLGFACQTAQATKIEALEALAKQVDTSQAEAGVIFAFNPLPWRRKALLEYHPGRRDAPITHLRAKDGSGIPIQMRPSDSMTGFYPRLAAWVDLPPFGYSVFSEESGNPPAPPPAQASFVSVSESGFGLSSIKAGDGTELLASQLGLVVIDDPSDTWAHGIDQFRNEIGRPTFLSSKVVEDGPVTRITRQKLQWRQSQIAVEIATFAAVNIVRLRFVIIWNEHQQILKLEIPTALADAKVFAMVPGAILERTTNGNEEPYQDWVALQGQISGNTYTLGLLNNSTYSYDCLQSNLRTILIRSAPYARHNPWQVPPDTIEAWQDQGRQERIFWLVAKSGKCTDQNLDRLANGLQTPAEYVMDSKHRGTQHWENSFFEITPDTVSVLCIKQAEDGSDAVIVRIQERSGKRTTAHLESSLLRLNSDLSLNPWELKTIRIVPSKHAPARASEVSTREV